MFALPHQAERICLRSRRPKMISSARSCSWKKRLGWKQLTMSSGSHIQLQMGNTVVSRRNLKSWQRRTPFEVYFYSLRRWYCFWKYFSVLLIWGGGGKRKKRKRKENQFNPAYPWWEEHSFLFHPSCLPFRRSHMNILAAGESQPNPPRR